MPALLSDDEFLKPPASSSPKLLSDDEFVAVKPGKLPEEQQGPIRTGINRMLAAMPVPDPPQLDSKPTGYVGQALDSVDQMVGRSFGGVARGVGHFLQAPDESAQSMRSSLAAAGADPNSGTSPMSVPEFDAMGNPTGSFASVDASPETAAKAKALVSQQQADAGVAMRARQRNVASADPVAVAGQALDASGQAEQQRATTAIHVNDPLIEAEAQRTNDAKGFWPTVKTALANPVGGIVGPTVESLAPMALGMGAGRLAASAAGLTLRSAATAAAEKASQDALLAAASDVHTLGSARSIAAQAGREAYDKVMQEGMAKTAGSVSNLAEGVTSGQQTGQQVHDFVTQRDASGAYAIPDDKLAQANPRYAALVQGGMAPAAAREQLANELADSAAPLAGVWTSLAGRVTGAAEAEGHLLAGHRTTLRQAAQNAGKEALEETVQNPGENYAQYLAQRQADPTQEYDFGGSVAQGVMGGLGMGAGMHGTGHVVGRYSAEPAVTLAGRPITAFNDDQLKAYASSGVLTSAVQAKVDAELQRRAQTAPDAATQAPADTTAPDVADRMRDIRPPTAPTTTDQVAAPAAAPVEPGQPAAAPVQQPAAPGSVIPTVRDPLNPLQTLEQRNQAQATGESADAQEAPNPLAPKPAPVATDPLGNLSAATDVARRAGVQLNTATHDDSATSGVSHLGAPLAWNEAGLAAGRAALAQDGHANRAQNMGSITDPHVLRQAVTVADVLHDLTGQRPVVYQDARQQAADGFEHNGRAYVNAANLEQAIHFTMFHETYHTAETQAARGDASAQQFVKTANTIFDMISPAGKEKYAREYLFKNELFDGRMTLDQALAHPQLKSEMVADFFGKRGTDLPFLRHLAQRDPTGFGGFVRRWIDSITNAIQAFKAKRDLGAKDVDQHIQKLNHAKAVAASALIEWRKANPALAAKLPAPGATSQQRTAVAMSQKQDSGRVDINAKLQQRIDADRPGAVREYSELRGTDGGRVLDTDLARELSPHYRANRARAQEVHQAARDFVHQMYMDKLQQLPPGGRVVLMAGGGGAGKSTAKEELGALHTKAALIYDGTLSGYDKAKQTIEAALAAKQQVVIPYVYRDPVESFVSGVLPRGTKYGRAVPLEAVIKGHVGSSEVVRRLAAEYRGDDRVLIYPIDNSRGADQHQHVSLEDLPPVKLEGLKQRMQDALDQEHRAGRVSDDLYRATLGDRTGRQAGPDASASRQDAPGERGVREGTRRGSGESELRGARHAVSDSAGPVRESKKAPPLPGQKLLDAHADVVPRLAVDGARGIKALIGKSVDTVGEKSGVFKYLAPMSSGTEEARAIAQRHINAERAAAWEWRRMDALLTDEFTTEQRKAMWNAADEENDLRREGITDAKRGLGRLSTGERAVMDQLHTYSTELWNRAKDLGMVKGDGVAYWTPRMMAMMDGEVATAPMGERAGTPGGIGRNLTTSAGSLKTRQYETSAETEAAMKAKGGVLVRDIRTMPMALAKLERAIAGRQLVDQVKELGLATGRDLVNQVGGDGYFTLDHPAFKQLTFKTVDGQTVAERTPIYMSKDFEGPLKAILTGDNGGWYRAYMLLKSKAMSAIMTSPFIHMQTILGRAVAVANPVKLTYWLTMKGRAIKADTEFMRQMIDHGMVPIGDQRQMMDVGDLVNGGKTGTWTDPNESWIALGAQKLVGMASEGAGNKVKDAIDKAGDFWHNTLLWNRIGDLQAAIAHDVFTKLKGKGVDANAAATVAAHVANRYAGALGREAMSADAHKVANVLLFSKSFNAANLGQVKDAFYGLPAGMRAQLMQNSDAASAYKALDFAKHKARVGLVLDLAYSLLALSLAQDWMKRDKDKDFGDQVAGALTGYQRRAAKMWANIKDNPFSLGAYDPRKMSSTADNEPDKHDRVDLGAQPNSGRHEYMRLPTGKVVEDLINWGTKTHETFNNKLSPFARAVKGVWDNEKDKFGTPIYAPSDTVLNQSWQVAKFLVGTHFPLDNLRTARDIAEGVGTELDKKRLLGNVTGFSVSQGNPRGPEGAVAAETEARVKNEKAVAMEEVRYHLKRGDESAAYDALAKTGMTPKEIRNTIKGIVSPKEGLSRSQQKKFQQHATDDEKETMESVGQ
jgi:hypothetical protein